ncbi:hypothetical protein [uncultured Campylobacter sp.]|uniref:hypothetical protein n=1 Tax=uncultured Campylobacter sp. TaxID=218934 RepID=UPI0026126198|nr:hypothetical protein [uncultured Campylobacter sp.]
MELREFEITFYGIEWHIASFNYYEKLKKSIKGLYKPITMTQDNKITYIFDVFAPSDDEINECKKYKEFGEICEFNFFDSATNKYKEKFRGTFIDALEYIKENFKDIE